MVRMRMWTFCDTGSRLSMTETETGAFAEM